MNSECIKDSKNSTQFSPRYEVLGTKKNNVIEALFDKNQEIWFLIMKIIKYSPWNIFKSPANKITEFTKKAYKENYHPANFPSLSFLGKIFKEIILQDAINLFSENNFLEGKNVFAYQRKQEHI